MEVETLNKEQIELIDKAFKNGIWVRNGLNEPFHWDKHKITLRYTYNKYVISYKTKQQHYYFLENYGIDWALTKEELGE